MLSCLAVALSLAWGPPPLIAGSLANARPHDASGPTQEPSDRESQEIELTLEVQDSSSQLIPARAQVIGADGHARPRAIDPDLLSHSALGGYFYVNGRATLKVPAGPTSITISRGFEYGPVTAYVTAERDTTVRITLERFAVLSARGWFGGDLHAHSRHDPLDYTLSPSQVKMVAVAEGLSVLHLLDDGWQFTGAPHALSDSTSVLYYSYEYRNRMCGHVALPGLRIPVGEGCCVNPDPRFPMILDLNAQVHARGGGLTVLAHPHTTDSYYQLSDWPGAGLGRELPMLAALGGLDAFDVASYSNEPDTDTAEWFDLLSAGLAIPPSAGTDAVLSRYCDAPPGGWRVYAREPVGAELDYDSWLSAFAAGHSFITDFPLIPEFTIGGSGMGDVLEAAGDSLVAPVHIETACAIGLRGVALVADGVEIWSRPFAILPATFDFDTTFQLRVPRPAWVLLRVDGPASHPALAAPQAVAYTNAVRILHQGTPARLTAAMARWLDSLDRFEALLNSPLNWQAPWQRDTVLARILRARQFYERPFRNPPAGFALLSPSTGAPTASGLAWQVAADPDSGDRVTYTVRFAEDSTLSGGWCDRELGTSMTEFMVPLESWYWWGVEASDLAGNVVRSTPPSERVFLSASVAGVPGAHREDPVRALPNPSRGEVRLRGLGPDVAIYDMAGRRIAEPGRGILDAAGTPVWDGSRNGRPAPPGIYLARGNHSRRLVRIIRLR